MDLPELKQFVVVLGLLINRGKVLLIQRNDPSFPEIHNRWELPGGKVHFGENLRTAIEREIREETGVEAIADNLLPFSYTAVRKKENLQKINPIIFCYNCSLVKSEINFDLPRKVKSAKWFDFQALSSVPMQEGSLRFISSSMIKDDDFHFIHLEKEELSRYGIEPARQYCIKIFPNDDEESFIKIQRIWGFKNGKKQSDWKLFKNEADLMDFLKLNLQNRLNIGYQIGDKSENFPYLALLQKFSSSGINTNQLSLF